MPLYCFGEDHFNCVIANSKTKCMSQPNEVDFHPTEFQMTWDHIVFKKENFSWFIRGCGFPQDTEIFPSSLQISQIALTDNSVLGLTSDKSNLYLSKISLPSDEPVKKCLPPRQIECKTSPIKIISSTFKDFYCVDDANYVYKIIDLKLSRICCSNDIIISKLVCGFSHIIILSDTGALYSFGNGSRGQLGYQEEILLSEVTTPQRITFFDDLPSIVKDVVCGGWHTLALTSDGDVYSWGWNENGALGVDKNNLGTVVPTPYPVDLGSADDPVTAIAAGSRHSLMLLKSGRVFSVGYNKYGQLGLGDTNDRIEPCEIPYKFNGKPYFIFCSRWTSFVKTKTE